MQQNNTLGNQNNNRRRQLRSQININYKHECDQLNGKLSQTNDPDDVRRITEHRQKHYQTNIKL